jgi:hypothetical protein
LIALSFQKWDAEVLLTLLPSLILAVYSRFAFAWG